ncbi:MAG: TetR/AcrR family transcriptional regulator [Thermodesulfobacteriota bacterium]
MGRQYEFNRDETLTKAMHVFWQKGYKATRMRDLVEEMGIQPGSIYNTFGDKHSLFIAAIEHYGEVVTTNTLKMLSAKGSPTENIKRFFKEMISRPVNKQCKGCFIVNTVVELAPHDEESASIVNAILQKIERAFFNCLNKAVEFGEISGEKDIKALSRYLASSTHGLLVTGKSKAGKEELEDIVKVVLSTLESKSLDPESISG